MKPRLSLPFLIAAATAGATPAGDAAAARLLQAMGGAEAWARVDAVTVEATHYEMREPVRYANRIVNDFTAPRVRFEAHAPGWDRWEVIDGEVAIQRRDQEPVENAQPERAADNLAWWTSNVYRTLRRLARQDPALSCHASGPDILEVHENGRRLNWFRLNPLGEPVQYGTGEVGVGTIFGPLTPHPSGIRYPAWGASPDAAWRYVIRHFVVNPELTAGDFQIPPPPTPSAPPSPAQP